MSFYVLLSLDEGIRYGSCYIWVHIFTFIPQSTALKIIQEIGSIEIQSRAAAHSNQQRRKQPPQLETFTFFETRIIKNASNNKADAERHNTLPN